MMKKKLLLFVVMLTGLTSVWAADGTLTITNVRNAVPGYSGTLDVVLSGTDVQYANFQFNITLPEGITYESWTYGEMIPELDPAYNIVVTPQGNNTWQFLGYASSTTPLTAKNGVLLKLKFSVAAGTSLGTKDGSLSTIRLAEGDATTHNIDDVNFSLETTNVVTLSEHETAAPAAIDGVNVKVVRELKGGVWNTICLPFEITEDKIASTFGAGTEIGYFTGYEVSGENVVSVSFEARTSIAAHIPYVIHVPATLSEFTVTNTSITTTDEDPAVIYGKYEGSGKNKHYEGKDMIGTYVAETIIPDYGVFLSNGAFTFSKGLSKLRAFRAYFDLYDAEYDDSGAAPSFILNFVDSSATAISTVETKASEVPAVYYNLSGQRVANPTKGLYIVNGKKVVVK